MLPDHDVKAFIGVEGINDINFMLEMSRMLIANGLDVPNLEQLEHDGKIVFFPLGGLTLLCGHQGSCRLIDQSFIYSTVKTNLL